MNPKKAILIAVGCICLALGSIGIVLPIQCQQLKRYWHLPRIKNQIEYLGQNTLR